jgi:geranylgeranyl pyrophosphate synthase/uncharacterized protein with NAD-binding domain and iron-sulfur cluster
MSRVVILGGGVAGLSAAHELAERGFEVVVLDRRHSLGGKARSIQVPPTRLGADPHRTKPPLSAPPWAPGEHGFRFFPGFYRHVIDTMARIPTGKGRNVADCLVPTSRVGITQYERPMLEIPARFPTKPTDALTALQAVVLAFSPVVGVDPAELAYFVGRIWQILTSCPERRVAEYEKIPWWTYIGAESRSPVYQKFLASGITRSLVAAKARTASTRTIGDIFVQLILTIIDPLAGSADRVLDGPTSSVWIEPWEQWLTSRGVQLRKGWTITGINCERGRITGVVASHSGQTEVVGGDHYICCMPIERVAPLLTPAILEADPHLANLQTLVRNVEWMNGVQFYLRTPLPLAHGHVIHIDSEWALTSISQLQFWKPEMVDDYTGRDEVRDILSVDVSDWEQPGSNGRPAMMCDRLEVALEVWEQLKRSVNNSGVGQLTDEDLLAWFMDPDIHPDPVRAGYLTNVEPLLVNLADSWRLRPDAVTAIPNFFLASDYVRTYTDLATMEAANEAARRAVNGVLDSTGYEGGGCSVWPLLDPPALAPLREYDAARFKLGLPWDPSWVDAATSGADAAEPALGEAAASMKGAEGLVRTVEQVKLALHQGEKAVSLGKLERRLIPPLEQFRDEILPFSAPQPVEQTSVPSIVPVTSPSVTRPDDDRDGASGTSVGQGDGPTSFIDRLGWYRHFVLGALRWALPDREPQRFLYGPMREFVERPAKGLRPGLCLATCRSYGGTYEDAIVSAAGLELLHHAFLVHDDIEDGSLSRRGAKTLHRQVGGPAAINIGDALNAYAMRTLRRNVELLGADKALAIFDEVDHLLIESLEGQAMELGWANDNRLDVGVEDYLRMVLKKTAWYSFIHPLRIGAVVAGAADDLDRFNRFGFLLGAAFQIQDDVLNLTGTPSRYGKEIGGDLWEGKRTIVLWRALRGASPTERSQLERFLNRRRDQRLPREVDVVYDILLHTGAIDWARAAAATLMNAAREQLPVAFRGADEGPDLDFVRHLVDYVVSRDL